MLPKSLSFLYQPYVLGIVSLGYVLGELGHYLIGVTTKAIAKDLHFGDIACQLSTSDYYLSELPVACSVANDSETCNSYSINGTKYCEWTYNGLGLDYQILAGPSFIAVFTVVGVALGFAADRFNRVRLLSICTAVFAVSIILCGAVSEYWQLVALRMIMAAGEAGCNPLATGILSDIFPEQKRALVMSIFNWGIYGGYGLAFPVGRYIPPLNIGGLGWRITYYTAGVLALIVGAVTWFTVREPERKSIGEDAAKNQSTGQVEESNKKNITLKNVVTDPRVVLLCLAASLRHCGGMCFAYNCDLYYRRYFPDYDLGWWLFAVTIVIGGIGIVIGGVLSDRFVARMGIRSRAIILGVSQIVATPFAFGSVYFAPTGAMITLGISYFFAEMWFGILFAILVEIVPLKVRSTTIGLFLFVMNNIGGNLPIAVEPVRKAIGFRESLFIFYAGCYLISSFMFLLTAIFMEGKPNTDDKLKDSEANTKTTNPGHINSGFISSDEPAMPPITSLVLQSKKSSETSRF